MNYIRHYTKLIRKAQYRDIQEEAYYEKHHIFPKSIFGEGPLVSLTLREHFVAHLLLYKIYIKRYGLYHNYTRKMGMAVHRMVFGGIRSSCISTSRRYELARKAVVDAKTGKKRLDMAGKKYFGADESTARAGIEKMRKKKTGMKINYPSDRTSPPCSDIKRATISEARLKTKEKYINMTEEEFSDWISKQTLFGKDGRKNANVTRAIQWRNEEITKYYE